MKKRFLIPVILMSCALMMSACGKDNTVTENTTPSVEETEEVEETTDETDEDVVDETTEEVEEESTVPSTETAEETTKPSTEVPTKKPVEETTKPSTEAPTKKPTEQATQAPTQKPTQPAHTHSWSQATCTSPATCGCGATNGSALGHNFGNNNQTCSNCGVENPNYQAPHTHNWSTKSWTEDVKTPYFTYIITCGSCGKEFSARLEDSYTGQGESEIAKKVAADYRAHKEAEGHSGFSTCEEVDYDRTTVTHHKRVCSCGAEEVID